MNYSGILSIKVMQENNDIVVIIKDSGSGIAEKDLSRVFEPYFTTKSAKHGSGLGLDITQQIIKKHKGHIDVSSVVNHGSTFVVYLPIKNGLSDTTIN